MVARFIENDDLPRTLRDPIRPGDLIGWDPATGTMRPLRRDNEPFILPRGWRLHRVHHDPTIMRGDGEGI